MKQGCESCTFRVKYDKNPKSFLGKLWRWHITFCPGWKSFMNSLSETERMEMAERYKLKKYLSNA